MLQRALQFSVLHLHPLDSTITGKSLAPAMFTALSLNQIPLISITPQSLRQKIPRTTTRAVRSDSLDHLQRSVKPPQPPLLQQVQNTPARRRASPLVLWDGFPTSRSVRQMMDTMDRFLEEPALSQSEAAAAASALNGYRRRGRTPWEIREAEGEYRLRFDMPGMTRKDVKVWVEDGMLVFRAEKQDQPPDQAAAKGEEAAADWPAMSFGKYGSRIALPDNAVADQIAAEVRDGVLYVTVPKATPASKVLDIDVK
ncbi:hypothetical protein KSP40_PGU019170 [Platanthera guangdongensis]|uniref:SHSP domain-containing protein n=1 Tax=Platanthera guangdongensis TaxID=2320717 RepID=A0ABR2LGE7_9ASPA